MAFRALAAFLFVSVSCGQAAPVTGTWTVASGTPTMSNVDTASPTWGNGTTDNADASSIYSSMPTITLANPGDKITLTGSATLIGINANGGSGDPTGGGIFRFGLYNSNGSADANGWLGYFVLTRNSAGSGSLLERNASNTDPFGSTTGASVLQSQPGGGVSSMSSATYDFEFSVERNATDGLIIDTAFTRVSDSANFAPFSFTDTTITTNANIFNRVGFQATSLLNADQIQMNNVDVTFTAVPEVSIPPTGWIALAGFLLLARRRRSHGSGRSSVIAA
jgi:hypothetical protein